MTDKHTLDLARQWSDGINAGVPVLAQAGHRAAAEVIRDLPDSWVDAERLREVVADHHIDMSEELMEALGALLPAPTPPTLADMTPEERAECQWMQADLKGGRIIIGAIADGGVNYIKQDGKAYWDTLRSGAGEIVPLPDLPRMEWPGNEPEDDVAAATGGELTTQDVVDECREVRKERAAAESASPRPEDVPEGETWLIRPYGNADPVPAFRVHASKYGPGRRWAYFRVGGSMIGFADDEDVALIARLVPETTKQDTETVFDPAYTYRDKDGDEWECIDGKWVQGDSRMDRLVSLNVNHGLNNLLPKHGPYTRIEDTK